tara:strand:+ start:701 stop:994 length:294 start_codon:yes stop_codon:yes gene_type:complete
MEIFELIAAVGLPIAGALVMGFFIFMIIQQIMENLVDDIKGIEGMSKMLIVRGAAMNNDIIKIDTIVSSALGLAPDLDRIARAENFVEDGKIDARRD